MQVNLKSQHRHRWERKYTKKLNIYIFIAIALDESIFLDVFHFPMKNIMSLDLEATPMDEATPKLIQ